MPGAWVEHVCLETRHLNKAAMDRKRHRFRWKGRVGWNRFEPLLAGGVLDARRIERVSERWRRGGWVDGWLRGGVEGCNGGKKKWEKEKRRRVEVDDEMGREGMACDGMVIQRTTVMEDLELGVRSYVRAESRRESRAENTKETNILFHHLIKSSSI